MPVKKISHITIIVRDQDEALKWYMDKLGFEKRADDAVSMPGYRWLTIAPKDQKELEVVLFKARDESTQKTEDGEQCSEAKRANEGSPQIAPHGYPLIGSFHFPSLLASR